MNSCGKKHGYIELTAKVSTALERKVHHFFWRNIVDSNISSIKKWVHCFTVHPHTTRAHLAQQLEQACKVAIMKPINLGGYVQQKLLIFAITNMSYCNWRIILMMQNRRVALLLSFINILVSCEKSYVH